MQVDTNELLSTTKQPHGPRANVQNPENVRTRHQSHTTFTSCPCSAVPIHEGNLEDLNEILHSVHVQSFPSTTNLEDLNEILLCVRVQPLPSTKAT